MFKKLLISLTMVVSSAKKIVLRFFGRKDFVWTFIDEVGTVRDDHQPYFGVGALTLRLSEQELEILNRRLRAVFLKAVNHLKAEEQTFEFKFKAVTSRSLPYYKEMIKLLGEYKEKIEFSCTLTTSKSLIWEKYIRLTGLLLGTGAGHLVLADYLDKPRAARQNFSELVDGKRIVKVLQLEAQGSLFIQLADVLLGAVNMALRGNITVNESKRELRDEVLLFLEGLGGQKKWAAIDRVYATRKIVRTINDFQQVVKSGGEDVIYKPSRNPILKSFLLALFIGLGLASPALAAKDFNVKSDTQSFMFVSGTNGNVGINTTVPRAKLEVDGTIYGMNIGVNTIAPAATLEVERSGTTSPFMVSTSGNDGNLLIMTSSGNIGIATTNPGAKLEINNGVTVAGHTDFLTLTAPGIQAVSQEMRIKFTDSASYPMAYIASGLQTGNSGYLSFAVTPTNPNGALTEAMRIASSGNIGIGSVSGSAKLDVYGGAARVWTGAGTVNYATNSGDMYVQGNLEVDGNVYLGDAIADTLTVAGNLTLAGTTAYTGSVSISTTSANAFAVKTTGGGSTIFNVDTSNSRSNFVGNVGINTTAPLANLEVVKTTGTAPLKISSTAGGAGDYLIVTSAGNVGIGTTSAFDKFQITDSIAWGTASKNALLILPTMTGAAGATETSLGAIKWNAGSRTASIEAFAANPAGGYATDLTFSTGTLTYDTLTERVRITSAGNVGINTTVPRAKLEVDGTIYGMNIGVNTIAPAATLEVERSGTASPFMLSTSGNDGDLFVVTSSGNVGIGTTTPGAKLEVKGSIRAGGPTYYGTLSNSALSLNNVTFLNDPGTGVIQVGGISGGTQLGLFAASTEYIRITNLGNVGIGSTAAAAKLDVTGGAARVWTGAGTVNYATNAGDAYVQGNLEIDGNVYLGDTIADNLIVAGNLTLAGTTAYTGSVSISSTSTSAFSVKTTGGGTTLLNVDTSGSNISLVGNVGINTTVPLANLEVVKTAGTAPLKISSTAGGAGDYMIVTSSGNVGIGSTVPGQKLSVAGNVSLSTGGFIYGDTTSQYLGLNNTNGSQLGYGTASVLVGSGYVDFITGGSARLFIDSAGNVGIGTITPSARTHIYNAVDGTFTGLVIDNRKTYGVGTGVNEISRMALSLSEATIPNPLSRVMGYMEAGVDGEQSSTEGWLAFGTRTVGVETEKLRITSTGNVGINTTAPQAKLEVDGAVYLGRMTAPSPTTDRLYNVGGTLTWNGTALSGSVASGTAGYFTYYPSTGTSVDDQTILYTDGTNIGIGTASPQRDVTLFRASAPTFQLANNTTGYAAGDGSYLQQNGNVLYMVNQENAGVILGTNSASRLTIDGSGNVGVATTTPNATFEVQKSGTTPPLMVSSSGSTDGDYVVVTSNGNVGIGTTVPVQKFQIRGQGGLPATSGTSQGGIIRVSNYNNNLALDIGQLVGSPYTSWIQNALEQNLNTNYPFALNPNGGNVGIATITPNATLEIQKSSTTPPLMVSSSGSTDGDYVIVSSSGNVGVGTTSPTNLMHIRGGDLLVQGLTNNSSGSIGLTTNYGFGTEGFKFYYDGTTGSTNFDSYYVTGKMNFRTKVASAAVNAMTIEQTGNIGINTTAPQEKLEVDGAIYVGRMTAPSPTTDRLYNVGGTLTWNGVPMSGSVNSGTSGYFTYYPSTGTVVDDQTVLYTDGTNVGIGTASPGAKLDVNGDIQLTASRALYSFGVGNYSSADATWGNFYSAANSYGTIFLTSGKGSYAASIPDMNFAKYNGTTVTKMMTIQASSGNVGIATSTPNATLEVMKSGTTPPLMVSSSGSTDGDYVIVTSSGNIGIGTATPARLLDVTGSGASMRIFDTSAGAINDGGYLSLYGNYNPGTTTTPFEWARIKGGKQTSLNDAGGYLAFSTAYGTGGGTLTERMRIDQAGNVGINTTVPQEKLEVDGAVYLGRMSAPSPTTDRLYNVAGTLTWNGTAVGTGSVASGTAGYFTYYPSSGTSVDDQAVLYTNGTNIGVSSTSPVATLEIKKTSTTPPLAVTNSALGDYLVVTSGGNVGIGTGAPSRVLTIKRIDTATTGMSSTSASVIRLLNPAAAGVGEFTGLQFNFLNDVDAQTTAMIGAVLTDVSSSWRSDLVFGTKDLSGSEVLTEYMRIKAGGNVGIATSTPNATLEVMKSGTTSPFMVSSSGATDGDYVIVTSAGNVGIGTINPGWALEIGSGRNIAIGNNSAIYARNAANTAWGEIARRDTGNIYNFGDGALRINSTNIGINTTAPQEKLEVDGAIYVGRMTAPSPTTDRLYNVGGTLTWNGTAVGTGSVASGTAGYFTYYPSTGTSVDDQTVLYTDGTNVGVGTTVPVAKLDVSGVTYNSAPGVLIQGSSATTSLTNDYAALTFVNTNQTANNYTGWMFSDNAGGSNAAAGVYTIFTDHANNYGDFAFITRSSGGYTEKMRILSTGNVGISTLTPNATLEIQKYSTNSPFMVSSSGSANGDYVVVNSAGNVGLGTESPTDRLDVYTSTATNASAKVRSRTSSVSASFGAAEGTNRYFSYSNGFEIMTHTTHPIAFAANMPTGSATPQMVIATSGNIGINTTAPQEKLEVDGAIYVGRMTAPSPTTDRLYNVGGTLTWNGTAVGTGSVASGTAGYFTYYPSTGTSVDDQAVLYTNGTNIGVSSTSPVATLEIKKTSTTPPLAVTNSALGDYLVITSGGNVGIGSASPNEKLAVNGNILATSYKIGAATVLSGSTNVLVGSAGASASVQMNTSSGSMILYGANVGIGTTSPDVKLVVQDTLGNIPTIKVGTTPEVEILQGSVIGQLAFSVFDDSTSAVREDSGYIKSLAEGCGSGAPCRWDGDPNNDIAGLGFFTLSSRQTLGEVMRISGEGNVGIGSTAPVSTLDLQGSMSLAVVSKTSSYTATASDHVILVSAASGAVTITLPTAATSRGRIYYIKKTDASANNVTIQRSGSDTIDGSSTQVITVQYQSFTVVSDGSNWWLI